jgi:hypothetical protein
MRNTHISQPANLKPTVKVVPYPAKHAGTPSALTSSSAKLLKQVLPSIASLDYTEAPDEALDLLSSERTLSSTGTTAFRAITATNSQKWRMCSGIAESFLQTTSSRTCGLTKKMSALKYLEQDDPGTPAGNPSKFLRNISTSDIVKLRAFIHLPPKFWMVMRAVNFLMESYAYFTAQHARGTPTNSTLLSPLQPLWRTSSVVTNVSTDDDCTPEKRADDNGFRWTLQRAGIVSASLSGKVQQKVPSLDEFSWSEQKQLLDDPSKFLSLLLILSSDKEFKRDFPEELVPELKHVASPHAFHPKHIGRGAYSVTFACLCSYVRGVAREILQHRMARRSLIDPVVVNDAVRENAHEWLTIETGGDEAYVLGGKASSELEISSTFRGKKLVVAVDGYEESYSAYRVCLALAGIADSVEVFHSYSEQAAGTLPFTQQPQGVRLKFEIDLASRMGSPLHKVVIRSRNGVDGPEETLAQYVVATQADVVVVPFQKSISQDVQTDPILFEDAFIIQRCKEAVCVLVQPDMIVPTGSCKYLLHVDGSAEAHR